MNPESEHFRSTADAARGLTANQRDLLCVVAAAAAGYPTRDGNEDRTMYSLRRRRLVTKPEGTGQWFLTDMGIDLVATWDARGSM